MNLQDEKAEKRGMCYYQNEKKFEVKIIKWHIFYGTGDYEDTPDIREDRIIDCFYVFYEDIVNEGIFNVGGGCYLSLEEAVNAVETCCIVAWFVEN